MTSVKIVLTRSKQSGLSKQTVRKNPFAQFAEWFSFMQNNGIPEHYAMVHSTVSQNGKPSSRVVLLKDFSEDGFVFSEISVYQ